MKKQFILIQQLENHEINEQFHIWQPPIDIFESKDKFIVKAEIAGMEGKGFDEKDFLRISGDKRRFSFEKYAIGYLNISSTRRNAMNDAS